MKTAKDYLQEANEVVKKIDVKEAIVYYFKNVIKPFVIQNGQRIEVPVMYGAPERWKSVQRDGFMRDDKGAIMAPI